MAVDTVSKRLTIKDLTLPFRMVSVVPTGTTSAEKRISDGYLYSLERVEATFVCARTGHTKTNMAAPFATGTMGVPHAVGTMNAPYATGTGRC